MSGDEGSLVSAPVRSAFMPILDALARHRPNLLADPRVCAIRPGYRLRGAAPVPVLVLAVQPGTTLDAPAIEASTAVPVEVIEATPHEQMLTAGARFAPSDMEILLREQGESFAPPRKGGYVGPTGGTLVTVEDVMNVEVSASPDVGWTVLRDFLARGVRRSLTVGIYQFTAPHIYKALRRTMLGAPKASLAICRQPRSEPIAEGGMKSEDIDGDSIVERLSRALGTRFEFVRASVGNGGAFASAYHIKVAVADQERFWLSSGNWQSSNQSPFDPIDEPEALPSGYAKRYNREYHAVVEHPALARTFEAYLDHDRELPGAFGGGPATLPDLELPPDDETPSFAPARTFAPLRLHAETVRVTPVLTPDNYPEVVLALLRSAKRSIWLQNQYINLNPGGDLAEFRRLVEALHDQGAKGLDVRIILRDSMAPEKHEMLLAIGFDPAWFRFQRNCHAKLIVVDGERALVGSHNWSNEGAVTNRDASLLFDHRAIATYYADVFLEDWNHNSRARSTTFQARVVRPGEARADRRVVAWSSVYDDAPSPRAATAWPSVLAPTPEPAAPAGGGIADADAVSFSVGVRAVAAPAAEAPPEVLIPFGVHGRTGAPLHPTLRAADLAERLVDRGDGDTSRERASAARRDGESFDLPFGTDANDLRATGWAVAYAPGTPQAVRDAIKPLVDLRRSQTVPRFFREIEMVAGETVEAFLRRHNVAAGTQLPHRLPYQLMLVGSPKDIPFEFQFLIDLEYSVGRLWLERDGQPDVAGFEAYAKAVVAYEGGAGVRAKSVGYFAPRHFGDCATEMSHDLVVNPLRLGDPDFGNLASTLGARVHSAMGTGATRAALIDLMVGAPERPAVLLTAGHGMGFDSDDPTQRALQGALLTQDWTGFGNIERKHYLAAADLPDGQDARGLVAFVFACFGAGTPRFDSYPAAAGVRKEVAPEPFLSALPQELLRRGALGVVGHVDLAWAWSFKPSGATSAQLAPFVNCLGRLLTGERVGNSTNNLHTRAGALSAEIADLLSPAAAQSDPAGLATRWVQRNDARAYVLLGDPAARLAFA